MFFLGALAAHSSYLAMLVALAAGSSVVRGEMTDPRDGQTYATVEVSGLTWHARNLNYASRESFCYGDLAANCDEYGRLYRWEVALEACPPGWHLSTEYEWQAMEMALGVPFAELPGRGNRSGGVGGRLKPGGDTGFAAVYGGWRRSEDGGYEAAGKNAAFWTAGEADLEHGWHRDVDTGDDHVFRSRVVKPYGLSVRCVKNWWEEDIDLSEPGSGARQWQR